MPWTFAHPAAVLPLRPLCRKDRLSFPALIVGSITPDVGYYLGCFKLATRAHTLVGLLTICLPTGLALLVLIRGLHHSVAVLLPSPHRQALLSLPPPQKLTTLTALCYGSIGIVIGAATHIAWDSFTHRTGYMVLRWPILQTPLEFGSTTFRLFELLQHLSTVLGALILVFAYMRWRRGIDSGADTSRKADEQWRFILLALITVVSMAAGVPAAYFASTSSLGGTNVARFIFRYAICCTTVFAVALCAASLLFARRARNAMPTS